MISDRTLRAADRLAAAADRGLPCAPVRDLLGDTDIEAVYAVQREVLNRRVAAGARVVGRKVGLTSPAVQQQLGVEQPDFGVLFDDMEVVLGAEACTGRLMQPKAEAEVAFVLAADLEEGLLDASQVRTVVDYAVAAVEIVDSRIARWDITIVDTVADNASSGMFVLGQERRALADFEPVDVVMSMTLDGQPVSAGTGAACLGDPLNAVAWLARTARAMGNHLRKGTSSCRALSGRWWPSSPARTSSPMWGRWGQWISGSRERKSDDRDLVGADQSRNHRVGQHRQRPDVQGAPAGAVAGDVGPGRHRSSIRRLAVCGPAGCGHDLRWCGRTDRDAGLP